MGWINFDDVLGQMQSFGLALEAGDLVIGTRRRCRHKDGGREKRGWFQLYELPKADGSGVLIVGSFGAFFGAENLVQKVELPAKDRKAMTSEQMEALRARIKADKIRSAAEAKRRADEAQRHADHAWRKHCKEGSRDQSEYLKRKRIEAHGGRFTDSGNFVIPMQDAERRTYGLQVIYGKKKNGRDKDFWPAGLAKKGHFFLLGGIPDRLLLIAEGFATAASIHQATGYPVAVAFDAGNLLPVAGALRAKYKRAKILICADDDYLTAGNPGVTHANTAALAVDGSVIAPVFAEERPTDHKGPTDFNDLHLLEGQTAVTKQIEAHLTVLGWSLATAPRGGSSQQGGGEATKSRRQAQSIMELDDVIERFVPLDDGTGDYVFDTWTNKVAKRSQMIALLPAGVRGDDIKRHPYWISRGAYYLDQVGFDPAGKDSNCKLNTWQGWPMKPAQGDCSRLLELLEYLCSADPNSHTVYEWLLCWMAYPLQNPGAKMASAVIMHGAQGTGKSTVFQTLAKIYGDYATVLNQRGLEDKFNSDWSDSKLFILAEEVVTRAEMWHIKNELKELVTGEWIRINPKNIAAYRQRNQVNICYLSNENQPLPLDNDDRRHLVIYTPPALSEKYYDEVFQELENGGAEAFYDYLLKLDISGFHPKKRPPMTEAKKKLIHLSKSSELRFVEEWQSGESSHPFCPCGSDHFYKFYLSWCKANGERNPLPNNRFFGFLHARPGWTKDRENIYEALDSPVAIRQRMLVPSDEDLALAAKTGEDNQRKAGATQTRWLTECFYKFKNALDSSL